MICIDCPRSIEDNNRVSRLWRGPRNDKSGHLVFSLRYTENMEVPAELPTYEIKPIAEQRPFEGYSAQRFLKKWCEVNDSIEPEFVDRENWERQVRILYEKGSDGKHHLYIPEDLHLWEMVAVMEAVDQDTFKNNPERRDKAKKEIEELGKTLKNAGIYIAQRLDAIDKGKEIAAAMAEEFYGYGKAVIERKKEATPGVTEIAAETLTGAETETVDKFLAGESLYESRRQRVQNGDVEAERRRTLKQFFAASARAFELREKGFDGEAPENGQGLKPWQDNTPFYDAFLKKIESSLKREIETPKRELTDSIFRRGIELLGKNMPFDKLPLSVKENYLHWENGETALREALHIDRLKADLENTRYFGTAEQIGAKEREIADKIQAVVREYSFRSGMNNPAAMMVNQMLNCVGASTLGGALMQEAGLNYLVGDVPRHSILFLVTADGKVEWRDMLNKLSNEDLTDEMIQGGKNDGSPLKVADIVAFSRKPSPEGLIFDINGDVYRDKLVSWLGEGQRQYVIAFGPEYGQKMWILNNLGNSLMDSGDNYQAVEVFQQAIALDPKKRDLFNGLGNALAHTRRIDEAIEAYRKAIDIDPLFDFPYNGLGTALYNIGKTNEAIEAYRKAIEINPKNDGPYFNLGSALANTGRDDEAIKAYKKYIGMADKEKSKEWIERAKNGIAGLQKKGE